MMTENTLLELAYSLLRKTKAGALTWEGTVSGGSFVTAFSKYSVKVTEASDEYGQTTSIVLSIYDQDGNVIEAISEDELSKSVQSAYAIEPSLINALRSQQPADVRELLRELYQQARRKALHVDGALDDLLSNLK